MHERAHDLSLAGVVIGAVGTFSQQLVLSVLGFTLTLIVHFLTGKRPQSESTLMEEVRYWRFRYTMLKFELDQLKSLKKQPEPAAVVPPFLPAEASSDHIEREP